jgi:hypothetical protein
MANKKTIKSKNKQPDAGSSRNKVLSRFREPQKRAVPKAGKMGIFTDEDVFKIVS